MEEFFKVRANNDITHATLYKNNYGKWNPESD